MTHPIKIKAIETSYKGYLFRSRLEARWAVFFDAIGLKWLYEPEGFELEGGIRYLPDFFLPDWNQWVEVKPTPPTGEELNKMFLLARSQNTNQGKHQYKEQVILCGTPGFPEPTAKLIFNNLFSVDPGQNYVALTVSGIHQDNMPFIVYSCFAMLDGGRSLDIWPIYLHGANEPIVLDTNASFILKPIHIETGRCNRKLK